MRLTASIRQNIVGVVVGFLFILGAGSATAGVYLAYQVHEILTNGTTVSAVAARQTETITKQIKQLIVDGNTQGARASKVAAAAAMPILNEIAQDHVTGNENRLLLCSIAMTIHDASPVVAAYCSS